MSFFSRKSRSAATPPAAQESARSSKPQDPRLISQVTFARLRSPRFTVTPPPTDFVGRMAELEELLANFERGVLIVGANGDAGVGTTALARRLVFALADDYLDGCLELDLRGAPFSVDEPLDPVEAQRRLLRPFYPHEILPDDPKALNELYRDTFSDRQTLVLLDNAASGVQLRPLIPPKPSAVIVTTSQADMALNWAKLYRLELGGLTPDEGRELLVRVSGLNETMHRATLDKIAEQFGYFPLALRVAASLLKEPFSWSPRELLKQAAATHKSQTALRGSVTVNLGVNVALEMLYEALSPELRSHFENLTVFPGAFTQMAASAVWNIDPKEAEETLVELARYNLLDYRTTTYSYVHHDLVRLYAQDLLLGQMRLTDTVVMRYADYVLDQAKHANELYQNEATSADGLLRFSALWPDLWKAWNRMSGSDIGWHPPQDPNRWLCEFPAQVSAILSVMRPLEERRMVLSRAVEAARALDDEDVEMVYQGELGRVAASLGDIQNALACHERQLEIAYKLRDRLQEADALMNVGQTCGALGDIARAKEVWRQSSALFRMIGDDRAAQVELWLRALEGKSRA
ncbi:MAG: tetratricopeptide repeat protein [Anaerolineae bacterium]|nr:tetratricopeptide repeat protein [Anaerolineae bacterium]